MTATQLARATSAEIRRVVKRAGAYAEAGHRAAATAELRDLEWRLIRLYAVTGHAWEGDQ